MSTAAREKMLQGHAQAANPQPARYSKCKTAVRPGLNDPCKCYPKTDKIK